jgi:predicted dehydrogenase
MVTYKIALIGTGRVGYQFDFDPELPDNHASAILKVERAELVAGVNRGREKLEQFGKRFQVNALYHDYEKMLDEVQPDICIIATHPELHCEMVLGCASRPSTKAIICEKPMALSLGECDRMIEACDAAGILLQINHNRRWSAEWNYAKQLVDEGAIGTLNHIYVSMEGCKPSPAWRSENEGPLLHDFTHSFDQMDMIAGEIDWLCGMAEQRMRPWAVEDFSAAMIRFKSGATGLVHGAELTEYQSFEFELRGSTGVIRIEKENIQLSQSVEQMVEPDSGFSWSTLQPREVEHPAPVSTYVLALNELLDTLEGKATLRSDGRIGRRSMEVVMGIYQSQLQDCAKVSFPISMMDSGVEKLRKSGSFTEQT